MVEVDGEPEIVLVEPVPVAVLRESVAVEELTSFYDRAFDAVADELERQQVGRVGPALAVYRGTPGATVDVAAGFPVQRPVDTAAGITGTELPGGMVVQALHVGAYDRLGETYERLRAFAADQGVELADVMWESYLTEPTPEADPASMRTRVSWLLRG
ncbi:GyrI-like domain-containing protein [Nocardioides solisilvae]|uniref:GyrI-like domain-containing protein n=1 Tax=Nocardioides solisilvae TaxID=1542435 RepID=UPI0013A55D91|nr:GyrI-like domain-containing protein [Nocardioides solisilvae]